MIIFSLLPKGTMGYYGGMEPDATIAATLAALEQFKPKSVFLYGSRSRQDFTPDSDYEIGVIFDDKMYVSRSTIHAAINTSHVRVYPFKWSELANAIFDTPFQRSIYLREIIKTGKTIAGDDLLATIALLPITTLDLVQDIRFYIGRSLDAMLSLRNGDTATGNEAFSKSCLFGVRDLIILELRVFPLGYDDIFELSHGLVIEDKYRRVIESAHILRRSSEKVETNLLFENISLLNNVIEKRIVAAFKARGDREII